MGENATALYPPLVGAEWEKLDTSVRVFHDVRAEKAASGYFDVHRGPTRLSRFVCWFFRLPEEGPGVLIQLNVRPRKDMKKGAMEVWDRTFAKRKLVTHQYAGAEQLLVESYGLMLIFFRLCVVNGALVFRSVASALKIGPIELSLPEWLSPQTSARVCGNPNGGLSVSVKISVPLAGLLLSYEGPLKTEILS